MQKIFFSILLIVISSCGERSHKISDPIDSPPDIAMKNEGLPLLNSFYYSENTKILNFKFSVVKKSASDNVLYYSSIEMYYNFVTNTFKSVANGVGGANDKLTCLDPVSCDYLEIESEFFDHQAIHLHRRTLHISSLETAEVFTKTYFEVQLPTDIFFSTPINKFLIFPRNEYENALSSLENIKLPSVGDHGSLFVLSFVPLSFSEPLRVYDQICGYTEPQGTSFKITCTYSHKFKDLKETKSWLLNF